MSKVTKPRTEVSYKVYAKYPHVLNPTRFKMPSMKPRMDENGKAIARIVADIEKHRDAMGEHERQRTGAQIGKGCGEYVCKATDGHRALLVKGSFQGEPVEWMGGGEDDYKRYAIVQDPEFFNTWKRAKVMTNEKDRTAWLELHGINCLTVRSSDSDFGSFEESVVCPTSHFPDPVSILLAWGYVDCMLGTWPLAIRVNRQDPANSPVWFEPVSKAWRYVLMPRRG